MYNVTVSNCFLTRPLAESLHGKGIHGYGMLVSGGVSKVSVHRNLFAHCVDRSPLMSGGTTIMEVVNNLIYNWDQFATWVKGDPADTQFGHVIHNHYKDGVDTVDPNNNVGLGLAIADTISSSSRFFIKDNIGPNKPASSDSNTWWDNVKCYLFNKLSLKSDNYLFTPQVTAMPSTDVFDYVLNNAGSRPKQRDSEDTTVVDQVKTGTGRIIDCIDGCSKSVGGYPTIAYSYRELTLPSNYNQLESNKYTKLENWLFSFYEDVQNVVSDIPDDDDDDDNTLDESVKVFLSIFIPTICVVIVLSIVIVVIILICVKLTKHKLDIKSEIITDDILSSKIETDNEELISKDEVESNSFQSI